MSTPAEQYLKLRSVGAPAVLLSLAMQGVFRGLKDTKTPLYATGRFIVIIVIRVIFYSPYIHEVKMNDMYVYLDWTLFSGWRCSKRNLGPDFHVLVEDGR